MFNVTACQLGIEALEAYHTKDSSNGGIVTKEPVHDWSSHDADGFRTAVEALNLGMVTPAVAKKALAQTPRFPDGSVVDQDALDAVRARRRTGSLALSGHSPL